MADLERFDEPTYGSEDVQFEQEGVAGQITEAIGPARKFLPHIIAVVVIAVIAWFAFDYFVASMLAVTVTVQDTEGKLLENSSLKIFASGTNELLFEGKDSSSYSVSLKPGNYKCEAMAAGYAIKRSSFDVSAEDTEPVIRLGKDLSIEILNLQQSFPSKLYVGGTKQFSVQLRNSSSSAETVDLVAESGLEEFDLAGVTGIQIPANSTKDVQLEISILAGTDVRDKKKGDGKKAVLRVKYTSEKAEADFTLYPNPGLEIVLSEADFSAKARENYNKDEDEISVKNENYFAIEDLVLSVEITSATKNDPSDVLTWFQFSEIANQPNPHTIEISSIPARSTVKKELQVILPMTAKKEPDIKGNIVLNAPYLAQPIKKTLTLDIKEEAEYNLALSLSPTSPVEIEWASTLGRYEDKMLNLRAKNSGQLDLHNIVFSIANNTVCSRDWLQLVENSIDLLKVGETKELKLNASAPIAVRGQEQSRYCNLRYRFDNPVVLGTYAEDTKVSFIEIVPEP